MAEYTFGANILENLTTGMYQDSKVAYREYIQNACDSIDKAVKSGLLSSKNDGRIEIWLDHGKRRIEIRDNGTGIKAADFRRVLGNIADSSKTLGEDKGFRGIGRLCGLAYCEKLIFTTSFSGEPVKSIMVCDANKMRTLINESTHGRKHSAVEVLDAINSFDSQAETADDHYFQVELVNINAENTALLDKDAIREYLSFVAPVPYQNTFCYRTEVYAHAEEIDDKIDEYRITLDGEPLFKKYSTYIKSTGGDKIDDISGVEFFDIRGGNGKLLGWMWFGLSQFKGVLSKNNIMRGLRLRTANIQIGTEDALQKLFSEDRFNSYFVGEVFSLSEELIPNSQRDYFNETPARVEFERILRQKFREMGKLCHEASEANSVYKQAAKISKEVKTVENDRQRGIISSSDAQKRLEALETEKQAVAEKLKKQKEKLVSLPKDSTAAKVLSRIVQEQGTRPSDVLPPIRSEQDDVNPLAWIQKKLPTQPKSVLKLLNKIFSIIRSNVDKETSDKLIGKIIEGLK